MYIFPNCFLKIEQKVIEDFYLQEENECFMYRGQNKNECFGLADLDLLNDSLNSQKWEFKCRKCHNKITIVHEENQTLEGKNMMYQKLLENGLKDSNQQMNSSFDSMFRIDQTYNDSILYQFDETTVNSKNESSEQDNNIVKAISSLRFKPETLIGDKTDEDAKTRPTLSDIKQPKSNKELINQNQQNIKEENQIREKIIERDQDSENQIIKRKDDYLCSINMIQEEKIENNVQNLNTSMFETGTGVIQDMQIVGSSIQIQKQKKKNTNLDDQKKQDKTYPQAIIDISKRFQIKKKPYKKKITTYRDYQKILRNRVQYNIDDSQLEIHSQPYLNNRFNSGGSGSRIVFYSDKTRKTESMFTFEQETEGVQIQDTTIQGIIKLNQAISSNSIKRSYQTKRVDELFREYLTKQKTENCELTDKKIERFYFTADMQFLLTEYGQWQFSQDINFLLFEKFFKIYKEAIHMFKQLILCYFSYKNKDLIINEFYVFTIQIFQDEIKNLKKSFMAMMRFFLNLTGKEVLVNNPVDYQILKYILEDNKINYSEEKAKEDFDYIEQKLQDLRSNIFDDLNFIESKLNNLLNDLNQIFIYVKIIQKVQ